MFHSSANFVQRNFVCHGKNFSLPHITRASHGCVVNHVKRVSQPCYALLISHSVNYCIIKRIGICTERK